MADESNSQGGGPWSESAGRIGAAPPPVWGPPPADQKPAPPAEAHSGPAPGGPSFPPPAGPRSDPPPAGAAPAFPPPPTGRRPGRRSAGSGPYWTPPAGHPNPYTAGGTAGTGYRYPTGSSMARGVTTWGLRGFWITGVTVSGLTLGLATPVFTLASWVMVRRARSQAMSANVGGLPVVRSWALTAAAWTALLVVVVAIYGVVGATTGSSSSGHDSYQPAPLQQVALGASATVNDQVGPNSSDKDVPVTVTVTGVDRNTKPGDAAVKFKVCAGDQPVDPLAAAFQLTLNGPADTTFEVDDHQQFPDPLYSNLSPRQCAAFPVDFQVPGQDAISTVTFGIDSQVQWPVS